MHVRSAKNYGISHEPSDSNPQTTGTMGLLSQLNRVVYRRATEDVLGIKLKQLIALEILAKTKAACSRTGRRR